MTAVREQVLAALKTRLETLQATIPTLKVYRNRRTQLDEAPGLAIEDGAQATQPDQVRIKFHTLQPIIEGYVTAATDDEIGAAGNELYRRVIDAIEADVTLGATPGSGPAIDCRERELRFELVKGEDAKTAECFFSLELDIDYATKHGAAGELGPA
jgi:hypothetical protein